MKKQAMWLVISYLTVVSLLLVSCASGVSEEEVAPPSRIAFVSDRDGNWEIYVMDADGSNQQRLTDNPDWDWGASWSP